MKNLSKMKMADILGFEYIGKGFDPNNGEEGFLIREYGTTKYKIIGNTQGEAQEWLLTKMADL